jgi:hypothetical protein
MTAADQLQPVTQQLVFKNLAEGPRRDRIAIYQRVMGARIETVDRMAWATYDQALRVQGVEEGVQSYSRVIELVLGTNMLAVRPSGNQAINP